jgi:aquaporin Z
MSDGRRLGAEAIGTFWLVLGGCGTAVIAGEFVGNHGVALAFGLTVVTMAYAIGHISGCHLNPAITVGLWFGGRFDSKDVLPYVVAQLVGAIVAAAVLLVIANGIDSYHIDVDGLAQNGFGDDGSPAGYNLLSGAVAEVVTTAFFLFVIMGVTARLSSPGFAGLAIGLCLTLIHLITIPVTNTSVNPARSTGPALFVGGDALEQLWLFWVAPLIGCLIGAFAYRSLGGAEPVLEAVVTEEAKVVAPPAGTSSVGAGMESDRYVGGDDIPPGGTPPPPPPPVP